MKRSPTYFGVFVTALATLMLEILLTRIISVAAWYHLAFFVISLAMLGMTAGAVLVFVSPRLFPDNLVPLRLAQSALAFALAIPVSVTLAISQPLVPVSDLLAFIALLETGTILAVPFIMGGVTITLALTRTGMPPSLVYGTDLCGAAAGCLLVIPLLDLLDAPSAAVVCGAVASTAAVAFFAAAGRKPGWPLVATLALVALGAGNASLQPHPLRPAWVKGKREDHERFDHVKWNTYSRVTVDRNASKPPMLWAVSPKAPPEVFRPVPWRMIEIDGAAGTMLAERGDLLGRHTYLAWDMTAFAHRLRAAGPAAVIGVGGGRDITTALLAGHKPVVGIEINDLIVDLHRNTLAGYSGLTNLDDVVLVADEARSYLSRDRREYTVITMSLIDTWASTGAGAYTLSENGLYTVEAWETFFKRLTPNGIFSVSRWYNSLSPGETARMTALAMEALWMRGAKRPARHIVLLQYGEIATLLASPSPFSPGDLYRIRKQASELGFNLLALPLEESGDPTITGLVGQRTRERMWRYAESQTLDLTPPTDMRPFFFNMLKPTRWIATGRPMDELDLSHLGNVQATQTLLYAVAVGLLLTLATVLVPLLTRRRQRSVLPRGDLLAAGVYFALIGLGFMYVEMGLLSRLNVLIGQPTVALAVLLGGIILFAGLGSLLSNRLRVERRWPGRLYPLLPAALVTATILMMESLLKQAMSGELDVRVAVSLALLAPPALGMGICFPLGLRLVERREQRLSPQEGNRYRDREPEPEAPRDRAATGAIGPWLWGINGAFGVCASGLALGFSMAWGIQTTLWIGAACYLLLLPCAWRLAR